MYSSQPLRASLWLMTGNRREKGQRMRSIALHFSQGTTSVDGFACSACDWFYVFITSEPDGTLPRREVDEAHARFAEHECEEYPKVGVWDDAP